MKTLLPKKLLLFLITDDLINWRLINKLVKVNPTAWCFASKNIESVIEAMGFNNYELMTGMYQYYDRRRQEAKNIPPAANRELYKELAEDIYTELERRMNNAQ